MQTRTALRHYSGAPSELGDGPLGEVAGQLLDAWRAKEAARLEDAHVRAEMAGKGPFVSALLKRFAAEESQSLLDMTVPMVTRADALGVFRSALAEHPKDRGLKLATAHVRHLYTNDPEGVLAVGDVARLRTHYARQFPKSAVSRVIDQDLPRVGFNTLPVAKLASIATNIRGETPEERQASYETVCRTHGLDTMADHHVRARKFLQGLVYLAEDSFESRAASTADAGGEAAADRALRRLACYDDPILRQVTAQENPFSETEPGMESEGFDHGPMESPELEAEVPHEEETETIVETESPVTGEPLVLELGIAEEGAAPGEGGEDESMGLDVTPDDVEGLSLFGQLDDFGGDELPDVGTDEDIAMDEGISEVEIEDPSAPGTMLKVTIEPANAADQAQGSVGGADMPPVSTAAPVAMGDMTARRQAKSPPSAKSKRQVEHITESYMEKGDSEEEAKAKAEGTAWKQWNSKKSFHVYAIRGGVKAKEPIDRIVAESMPRALRQVARKLAELGPTGQAVRARPEEFAHRALVVLDAAAGNHLYVVAADRDDDHGPEKGSEFYPEVNEQQPAQVTLPGGGADGTTVLKSDGGFAQPRSTRKIDVSPGASAVGGKKGRKVSRDEVLAICAAHGLDAKTIEDRLVNRAERVTAGKWSIEISDAGQVHLRTAGRTFERDLADLDAVIADFQARAAYQLAAATPGAQPAGQGTVAPARAPTGLHYEARPYFQVGCAQCGRVSEYVMPDTPENVRCASCNFETHAAAVAVQLETRRAAAFPGYMLACELPKTAAPDMELNARRVMTAIHEVVPSAVAQLRGGKLEVSLRPADEAALNRVCRVLEDRFGVSDLNARAAGRVAQPVAAPNGDPSVGVTPQSMSSSMPSETSQVGVNFKGADVPPTFNPPAKPAPTPTSQQPNPGAPGLMPESNGMPAQQPNPMMTQGVMPPPPEAPGASGDVSVTMGATTGTPAQQQAAAEGGMMRPAAYRAGLWNVAYRGMDGRAKVMPVEATSEQGARRIFAAYDSDAEIIRVTAQGAPIPPAEPVPPAGGDMAGPGGPPPGPDAGPPPGGPMEPGMPGASGGGVGPAQMSPEIQEAIRAAMITLRNSGIDVASAVRDFQTQFKKVLERFGDETSPARQALGAEIIRAAQEAWSKPALLDLTAARRQADKPPAPKPGAGVSRVKSPNKSMPAPSRVRHDIPTPSQFNTQQPDWFDFGTGEKVLGPDSETDEDATNAIVPGGKIKTQPSVPEKASGPLSSWGDGHRGTENRDPGTFGAGKPPRDGSYGLVGEGTSLAPTDLGRDSQTGNNATTSKWDGVPRTNDRSKPGGQGAPRIKGRTAPRRQARTAREVTAKLAALNPDRGLTYLARSYESGKWFLEAVRKAKEGEFPEAELWNARDASIDDGMGPDIIPQLAGPAQEAWELALSVLV